MGQAVFRDEAALAAAALGIGVRRLHALHDDVLAAELADLFLRLVARPLADAEHGDDGGDAEDDPQRREHGAQLVQPQAFHAEAERAPQVRRREGEMEDGVHGKRIRPAIGK